MTSRSCCSTSTCPSMDGLETAALDPPAAPELRAHADHLHHRRLQRRAAHGAGICAGRGRLHRFAGRSGGPARQGQGLRRPLSAGAAGKAAGAGACRACRGAGGAGRGRAGDAPACVPRAGERCAARPRLTPRPSHASWCGCAFPRSRTLADSRSSPRCPKRRTAELLWPENAARAVRRSCEPMAEAGASTACWRAARSKCSRRRRGRSAGRAGPHARRPVAGLSTAGREFDTDTLSMATKLAGRAAIALDNARLYAKMQEQDRRKDEFSPCWRTSCATRWRRSATRCTCWVHTSGTRASSPGRERSSAVNSSSSASPGRRPPRCRAHHARQDRAQDRIDRRLASHRGCSRNQSSVRGCVRTRARRVAASEPLRIRGDFARTAQVLANLINNAAKYTNRGASHRGRGVARGHGCRVPRPRLRHGHSPGVFVGHLRAVPADPSSHAGSLAGGPRRRADARARRLVEMEAAASRRTAKDRIAEANLPFVFRARAGAARRWRAPRAPHQGDHPLDLQRAHRGRQPRRRRQAPPCCSAQPDATSISPTTARKRPVGPRGLRSRCRAARHRVAEDRRLSGGRAHPRRTGEPAAR